MYFLSVTMEILSTQLKKYWTRIRVGQYFPHFVETISNSDLNASHNLYHSDWCLYYTVQQL